MGTERKKGRKARKAILAAAIVLAAALCAAVAYGGNFLFNFALNPDRSADLQAMTAAEAEPEKSSAAQAFAARTDDTLLWQAYESQAAVWFEQGEAVELVREDGGIRRGSFFRNEGHSYAIVCHGYHSDSGSMAGYASMFYELGMSVLAPDALAHGESDGQYIGMGWLEREDILGWIGAIVEADPQADILLFGVSMGGATVMMAAGEELPDNVKCIVEDCGYTSVWDEFAVQLDELFGLPPFPLLYMASLACRLQAGYGFGEASCVEQLKKAEVPILFIHGGEDTFVPTEMLDAVYEACASEIKEKLVIPGAGHAASAATDPVAYWSAVEAFVGRFIEIAE